MREGKLKSKEDIVDGLETFPESLLKLFTGENFGKLVLRVAQRNSVRQSSAIPAQAGIQPD